MQQLFQSEMHVVLGKVSLIPICHTSKNVFKIDGCENAQQLWREIVAQGYPGTNKQVLKWLQLRRTQRAPTTQLTKGNSHTSAKTSTKNTLPSSKQLAWLLVRALETLTDTDTTLLKHLLQDEQL